MSTNNLDALETAEAHVFDVGVFVNAVFGAFATESRLLDSTKRRFNTGHNALVDTDHSHLQALGHAPDLSHVARVEVACNSSRSTTHQHTLHPYRR